MGRSRWVTFDHVHVVARPAAQRRWRTTEMEVLVPEQLAIAFDARSHQLTSHGKVGSREGEESGMEPCTSECRCRDREHQRRQEEGNRSCDATGGIKTTA